MNDAPVATVARVDTILREQADVALIDIGLPQLDGYGAARCSLPGEPAVR